MMEIKLKFGLKHEPVHAGLPLRTQVQAGQCTEAQLYSCTAKAENTSGS